MKIMESEVYNQNNKGDVDNWTWYTYVKLDVIAENGKEYEVKYSCALNTQELPDMAKNQEAKRLIETIKPVYLAKELEAAGFTVVNKKPIVRYSNGW